ncbi:uncharacterized protein EI90DRAFT_3017423 [Cantharellus anzutake]|uniref:uncharacterized protein n=1 Tax=Cantharellus anzutake TaxID=1750568 RepID=UPI0019069473|nr:uncharacterized protein EI90DRAFT_3017423 [Cantharellus anzutake]KAF8328796.1 hypothetical protein EI90DRAFT_3017423 [Cantharellus anzutake]
MAAPPGGPKMGHRGVFCRCSREKSPLLADPMIGHRSLCLGSMSDGAQEFFVTTKSMVVLPGGSYDRAQGTPFGCRRLKFRRVSQVLPEFDAPLVLDYTIHDPLPQSDAIPSSSYSGSYDFSTNATYTLNFYMQDQCHFRLSLILHRVSMIHTADCQGLQEQPSSYDIRVHEPSAKHSVVAAQGSEAVSQAQSFLLPLKPALSPLADPELSRRRAAFVRPISKLYRVFRSFPKFDTSLIFDTVISEPLPQPDNTLSSYYATGTVISYMRNHTTISVRARFYTSLQKESEFLRYPCSRAKRQTYALLPLKAPRLGSRVEPQAGSVCSADFEALPRFFRVFPSLTHRYSSPRMSRATPQPECIKLKPKELRPPGLSISLSSDVDPEPIRVPIVATPTRAVVFDMRVEFKFKELRPPGPSFEFSPLLMTILDDPEPRTSRTTPQPQTSPVQYAMTLSTSQARKDASQTSAFD